MQGNPKQWHSKAGDSSTVTILMPNMTNRSMVTKNWKQEYCGVKVKVAQLCLALCNPMDYTVHGILQARILEWVAFSLYRGSSQSRDPTQFSCVAGRFFTSWATVQFSPSVMSNSLRPQEPQHARPPCPSSTARVHPNPCPLSQWCHPTISSSVVPFSSCPQSFPQGKPNCGVSCFERCYDLRPRNQSSHSKAVENKPVENIPSSYSSPPFQCFGDVLNLLNSPEGKGDCWGG